MTTTYLPLRRSGLAAHPGSSGVSPTASDLADRVASVIDGLRASFSLAEPYREARAELDAARTEATVEDWDGHGARPMSLASYELAKRFLGALPTWSPPPEVSVDPDGEVALDWFGEKCLLSISVGPKGELSYAGAFGVSRVSGEEYFTDEIPDAIVETLRRLIGAGVR